jgi:hypothetical protein
METCIVKCQNCGKHVLVTIPFYGCVFCEDCKNESKIYTSGTEDFIPRFKYIKSKERD